MPADNRNGLKTHRCKHSWRVYTAAGLVFVCSRCGKVATLENDYELLIAGLEPSRPRGSG